MNALPSSDAGIEGGTNGALDGASLEDLRRGYTDAQASDPHELECCCAMCQEQKGGFLNRPQGWER